MLSKPRLAWWHALQACQRRSWKANIGMHVKIRRFSMKRRSLKMKPKNFPCRRMKAMNVWTCFLLWRARQPWAKKQTRPKKRLPVMQASKSHSSTTYLTWPRWKSSLPQIRTARLQRRAKQMEVCLWHFLMPLHCLEIFSTTFFGCVYGFAMHLGGATLGSCQMLWMPAEHPPRWTGISA